MIELFNLKDLKKNFRPDFLSGFLVVLIALPLCLGIAKASGFPPIAGIYTAIVGGLIVTFFTNSQLTIKGPAAGLIVIALGAVEDLGEGNPVKGYQLTLAVIVISGILQILLGLLRTGKFADFFPSAVIHGMLAAIGIIIMAKQVHIALGVTPDGKGTFDLIKEIPNSFRNINPEVAIIGFFSLFILAVMPLIKNKIIRVIPAPLVVLAVAIPLAIYFDLSHSHDYDLGSLHFHIEPSQLLVALPSSFLAGFTLPDFSMITSPVAIKYIMMFALVGSIESLLSTKAIDILDPKKRKSNFNLDLIAVGIGNTICGFIGGLPMISEIVRSSANINNGAKSRWANFYHGLILLGFIVLAAPLIQMIPNAALGAMLIYTGYRLASPREFKHAYKIGAEQLSVFLVTCVTTLFIDLLVGVGVGICFKLLIHVFRGAQLSNLFSIHHELNQKNGSYKLSLSGNAVFSNFLMFKDIIKNIPRSSNLEIDFKSTNLIDHTFMENLHQLEDEFNTKSGKLKFSGLEYHHQTSHHPFASRVRFLNSFSEHGLQVTLTPRQLELQEIAIGLGLDFEPIMSPSLLKISLSGFPLARKATYGRNLIVGNQGDHTFMIVDLHIEEFSALSKEPYDITILYITNLNFHLPDFALEEETFLNFLEEMKGMKDIDFQQYPEFSNRYYLSGEDEEKVRKLFNKDLIEFFETNTKYFMECEHESLLIHGQRNILKSEEIRELLEYKDLLLSKLADKS